MKKKVIKTKKKVTPKPKVQKPKAVSKIFNGDIAILEEALGGNRELILFFICWLKNNRNATKAYMELHPDVSERVAAVLGSRTLTKVDIPIVLEAMGMGTMAYLDQLREGMAAMTQKDGMLINSEGIQKAITEVPDHKTRRAYHEALGKMLGFEGKDNAKAGIAVQVNFNQHIQKEKQEFLKED